MNPEDRNLVLFNAAGLAIVGGLLGVFMYRHGTDFLRLVYNLFFGNGMPW